METIRKLWAAKVLLFLFLFFTVWWLYMTIFLSHDHPVYGAYGTFYGIIALWGAIWGFIIARHYGGYKSIMGRAIIMFSLGLFAQEFGQCAYTYYIFVLHNDIPYPSVGDIGFFGTIPFYIYGAYLLSKASGIKFTLQSYSSQLQALLIPLGILAASYFLILHRYSIDSSHPMVTFLNYGYPLGQAIYISIALLTYSLTRGILGGIMRSKILLIIIAFCAQFLADYAFIIFKDSYYPGSILDYLYVVAYVIMAFGIFELQMALMKLRHAE